MTKTALVLGATGGVGGEIARALIARGWLVKGLTRKPRSGDGIQWVTGDAMDRATVVGAAEGADVIVHAVNPPGYRDWDKLVLPMLDNSIAAARAATARIALPGTIYNYDPRTTPVARPDSPQGPTTHKGGIRMEMERRLEHSGARALILRAGDYFGPRPGNSWLSSGMITPGQPIRTIMNPARPGVGHAWAYLPDVGEAFGRLLDVEATLPDFSRYHFTGYWDADGGTFADAVKSATGDDSVKVRRMPWSLLPLIGLFNVTMAETAKMRIFWDHPLALDNASLEAAIGPEPHTPLPEAMAATLKALGCIA